MREKLIHVNVLLLRFAAALVLFSAGGLKLFGWFGGMPEGTPLTTLIIIASILELIGGVLILLGLFTRTVAFILSGEMAFAFFLGHVIPMKHFLPIQNMGDSPFLLCFIFFFLFAFGGGRISIDHVLKRRKLAQNNA